MRCLLTLCGHRSRREAVPAFKRPRLRRRRSFGKEASRVFGVACAMASAGPRLVLRAAFLRKVAPGLETKTRLCSSLDDFRRRDDLRRVALRVLGGVKQQTEHG